MSSDQLFHGNRHLRPQTQHQQGRKEVRTVAATERYCMAAWRDKGDPGNAPIFAPTASTRFLTEGQKQTFLEEARENMV